MSAEPRELSLSEELLQLGSATVGESGAVPMSPSLRRVWDGAALCAPVYTVRCSPGDNLAVHVAVARAPAGSALVVSVGERREHGYWGEVLTTAAESRGLAGLVIDGGVRDVAALEAHGFPVFATTIALKGATKLLGGETEGEVEVGGAVVRPGDWVLGDADGVVVIEGARIAQVLDSSRSRAQKEMGLFEEIKGGRTTLDLLGLDASKVPAVGEDS